MDEKINDKVLCSMVRTLPLKLLTILSSLMNPEHPGRDWKALAGEFNFTLEEVNTLGTSRDPTLEIIKYYDSKMEHPLVFSELLEYLHNLCRRDVIQDLTLESQKLMTCRENNTPILYENLPTNGQPDYTFSETYDVFVSYAREDIGFAKTIVHELERKRFSFQVCIDFRDFMPGFNEIEQMVEVIESRCRKVIVILSRKFNESDSCDHQAKVALSLSPGARRHKVIPIKYDECSPPPILRGLTYLDYTDADHREFFWERLTKAITIR